MSSSTAARLISCSTTAFSESSHRSDSARSLAVDLSDNRNDLTCFIAASSSNYDVIAVSDRTYGKYGGCSGSSFRSSRGSMSGSLCASSSNSRVCCRCTRACSMCSKACRLRWRLYCKSCCVSATWARSCSVSWPTSSRSLRETASMVTRQTTSATRMAAAHLDGR